MLKKISLSFLVLFIASCGTLKEAGFIYPHMQRSKNIRVISSEFDMRVGADNRVQAYYNIFIEFPNIDDVDGKFIIAEFQNPENRKDFSVIVYKINSLRDIMNIKSDNIYGLQPQRGYLVKISLSNDDEGKERIETIKQYVNSGAILLNKNYMNIR